MFLVVLFIVIIYSQNHYDFPLSKTNIENALEEVDLDWHIIDEYTINEGNSVFRLSSSELVQTLTISSMKKDEMFSFSIIPNIPMSYESIILDEGTRKQLLQLTCELTGIDYSNSIYRNFYKYLASRDSLKYGDTNWYYSSEDKILMISLKASSVYIGKYQISSIQVMNSAFFKEIKNIFATHTTEKFQSEGDQVYKGVSLKDLKEDFSEGNQSITRIVTIGRLTNTQKIKDKELEGLILEDSDYSLYAKDYLFAYISDRTDTIKVLLPRYIEDLSLLNNKDKEWHITYHHSSGIYVVDYGLDIH